MDPPINAYSLALEQESRAWQVLQGITRSDPRFAEAVSDWRAAADRIGVEAEKLLKHHPKPCQPSSANPPALVTRGGI